MISWPISDDCDFRASEMLKKAKKHGSHNGWSYSNPPFFSGGVAAALHVRPIRSKTTITTKNHCASLDVVKGTEEKKSASTLGSRSPPPILEGPLYNILLRSISPQTCPFS